MSSTYGMVVSPSPAVGATQVLQLMSLCPFCVSTYKGHRD